MRLVIDLQAAQGGNSTRGIGRYARELALAMARRPGRHDVIVALNGGLPTETLRTTLAAVLPPENIRLWHAPGGTAAATAIHGTAAATAAPARRHAAEAIRAEFLAALRPDLLHVSSIFEGWSEDAVTFWPAWRERPPTLATGYDLIPLIRRADYLDSAWKQGGLDRWYLRCLHQLRLCDAALAISASSRRELIDHLGMEPNHVFNISAGIGPEFRPPHLSAADRAALLRRLGLPPDPILFLGGGDIRKNEAGLIRAYALLPAALRARHKLAIVRKGDPAPLHEAARAAGLAPDALTLVDFVPDADLPGLYESCALFVLPSLHEGFGLPAAEAMACGAPTIASNTTSLPEVIGRPDALFNPAEPAAIAARMQAVLENPALRADLAAHALRQAARFNWPDCAARAWAALEATHERLRPRNAVPTAGWRPRLAFVSPLPPQPSGIADYSAELLPDLARHYDITLVADIAETSAEHLAPNLPVIPPARFLAEADSFDRVLYQIGNSEFHATALEDLLPLVPGVAVLHDAYLSGARNWIAHHRHGDPARFIADLYRSHGWPAVLHAQTHGAAAALRDHPCSLPVLQDALAIIQHSRHGRDILSEHFGPQAAHRVHFAAHPRHRFTGPTRAEARRRLGIADDTFLVCSFGYVAPTKLPELLVEAWRRAGFTPHSARLVFVGQTDSGGQAMLASAATALGAALPALWTGHLDSPAYRDWLAAADVAVQLRAHSRGETSYAIVDCMAAGLAVVVNDHGSAAELPSDAVLHLPAEPGAAALAAALQRLRDPAARARLGDAAQRHVARHHAPREVARAYRDAIEAAYAAGPPISRHMAARSLARALPEPGQSEFCQPDPGLLADCARAIARNHPRLAPPTLLIDAGGIAALRPRDPLGRALADLLGAHPPGLRVDLVARSGATWQHARARAAAGTRPRRRARRRRALRPRRRHRTAPRGAARRPGRRRGTRCRRARSRRPAARSAGRHPAHYAGARIAVGACHACVLPSAVRYRACHRLAAPQPTGHPPVRRAVARRRRHPGRHGARQPPHHPRRLTRRPGAPAQRGHAKITAAREKSSHATACAPWRGAIRCSGSGRQGPPSDDRPATPQHHHVARALSCPQRRRQRPQQHDAEHRIGRRRRSGRRRVGRLARPFLHRLRRLHGLLLGLLHPLLRLRLAQVVFRRHQCDQPVTVGLRQVPLGHPARHQRANLRHPLVRRHRRRPLVALATQRVLHPVHQPLGRSVRATTLAPRRASSAPASGTAAIRAPGTGVPAGHHAADLRAKPRRHRPGRAHRTARQARRPARQARNPTRRRRGHARNQIAQQHRRQQERRPPHGQPMQRRIGAIGIARQPRRRIAAHPQPDQVRHQHPHRRPNPHRGSRRRVARQRIHQRRRHPRAQHVQHQRHRHRHHGPGKHRSPRNPRGQGRPALRPHQRILAPGALYLVLHGGISLYARAPPPSGRPERETAPLRRRFPYRTLPPIRPPMPYMHHPIQASSPPSRSRPMNQATRDAAAERFDLAYLLVSGAATAARAPDILRGLLALGLRQVLVLPTPNAARILAPNALAGIDGAQLVESYFDAAIRPRPPRGIVLFAPCSFNSLNKLAHGITDTLPLAVAAEAIGRRTPVIVAPSLNQPLLDHPVAQAALRTLPTWGVHLVAMQDDGTGPRLAPTPHLLAAIRPHLLAG